MPTPDGSLHLRILRVTCRQGRLVIRSGLPTGVAVLAVAALPALLLGVVLANGRWASDAVPTILFGAVLIPLLWAIGGPWCLTLGRQVGRATLWRGPWRTSRPLSEVVAVRVVSMRQAQIARVRREQTLMPYAPHPDLGCGVALVEASGRWQQVTRAQDRAYGPSTPRLDEAEQVARRVADYLDVPLLPRYETPPGGVVPPPLEG